MLFRSGKSGKYLLGIQNSLRIRGSAPSRSRSFANKKQPNLFNSLHCICFMKPVNIQGFFWF